MKDFDFNTFNKELTRGDSLGLDYLKNTIMKELKEKKYPLLHYTKEEYLLSLFYATLELNTCNHIYETENIENNFNFDIYAVVRNKFLEEFCKYYGYDVNKLYK